jgi:hypothetical protein
MIPADMTMVFAPAGWGAQSIYRSHAPRLQAIASQSLTHSRQKNTHYRRRERTETDSLAIHTGWSQPKEVAEMGA